MQLRLILALPFVLSGFALGCADPKPPAEDTTHEDTVTGDTAGGDSADSSTEDTAADSTGDTADSSTGDTADGSTEDAADTISGCDPADCDDGDPCTVDGCLEESCYHLALNGCTSECAAESATKASEAGWDRMPGDKLVALGEAWVWQDNLTCTHDGICNCAGSASLRDAAGALQLRGPTSIVPADTWSCESRDSRTPGLVCDPLLAGVSYIVWGTGAYSWETNPTFAAAPMPRVDALRVIDWCLASTATGLVGAYDGRITDMLGSDDLLFKAVISQKTDGSTQLTISEAACLDNNCDAATAQTFLPDQTIDLQIWSAGGRADLVFNQFGTTTIAWRFYSQRHALTGLWAMQSRAGGYQWEDPATFTPAFPAPASEPDDGGRQADPAPPPEGTLTLTRTAPADIGSACE